MEDTLSIRVEGMTCNGCSSRLKKQLEKHPQIEKAEVDHTNGIAMIAGKVTEEMVAEIVEASGFTYKGPDVVN
ncbi:MAG: heavy-metal-associated domain-containing protein [Candidatus Cyclonatronum sp.]|uniref:heavy-metal-associated domain-containing protein n=1 Tax=Cyclonatronum sp. TaxID=3024185 RepID=UPI0025BA876C|nr:heavy metal-associated domain-containing protein [Cyclonatronum sp.]MCH8485226.1 heavy-metal-associated domain-containing protein [Cyclonatronum sp.]